MIKVLQQVERFFNYLLFSFVRLPEWELSTWIQQHFPNVFLRTEIAPSGSNSTSTASVNRAPSAPTTLHRAPGEGLSIGHLSRTEDVDNYEICQVDEIDQKHRKRDGQHRQLRHLQQLQPLQPRRGGKFFRTVAGTFLPWIHWKVRQKSRCKGRQKCRCKSRQECPVRRSFHISGNN